MNDVVIACALIGVLVVGMVVGLVWRGSVVIGDRRTLDRISVGIEAEQRMRSATQAAMAASRQAVRNAQFRGGRSDEGWL